jgi:hypothetical protein
MVGGKERDDDGRAGQKNALWDVRLRPVICPGPQKRLGDECPVV